MDADAAVSDAVPVPSALVATVEVVAVVVAAAAAVAAAGVERENLARSA